MNSTAQASSRIPFVSQKYIFIGIVVVSLVVSATAIWLFLTKPSQIAVVPEAQTTPTPFVTPTPVPLPAGKQIYNISSQGSSIKITQAIFDPLDASVGQKQTISVSVRSNSPIDSVSTTITADSTTTEIPLTLASGTARDGVWSGTWSVNLSHIKIYGAKITVVNGEETDSVDLWFR